MNEVTATGFTFGAAMVERVCSDDRGAVTIAVRSVKQQIHIRVTKSGQIRVWQGQRELTTHD